MSEQESAPVAQTKEIKVSEILADLSNGLTRDQIKEKYSLSGKEMVAVFKHSKLKGRKTKTPVTSVVVVDDTTPVGNSLSEAESETPTASAPDEEVVPTQSEKATRRASKIVEEAQAEALPTSEETIETPEVEELPTLEEKEDKSPWDR